MNLRGDLLRQVREQRVVVRVEEEEGEKWTIYKRGWISFEGIKGLGARNVHLWLGGCVVL